MTMIDPATGWLEIDTLDDNQADTAAKAFDSVWLSRYPKPLKYIHDNGKEFLGNEFTEMLTSFGIKKKMTTVGNPQANGVIERVHQVLGDMLRTFEIGDTDDELEFIDWDDFLQPCTWAVRSTYHTTMEATPGQLVYGRDMIYNIKFKADWEGIRRRKQDIIDASNKHKNANRIDHKYKGGDYVQLLNDAKILGHFNDKYFGPYKLCRTHANGNVTIAREGVDQRVNIRRITPYYHHHTGSSN